MLFLLTQLSAAEALNSADFNKNTANTLGVGEKTVGVFAPLRNKKKKDTDLEIHPGWTLVAPHVSIKKSYNDIGDWMFASKHQIGYPTFLLRQLSRSGTGGVLPPDSTVPNTFVLHNDVYFGKKMDAGEFTLSLGTSLST